MTNAPMSSPPSSSLPFVSTTTPSLARTAASGSTVSLSSSVSSVASSIQGTPSPRRLFQSPHKLGSPSRSLSLALDVRRVILCLSAVCLVVNVLAGWKAGLILADGEKENSMKRPRHGQNTVINCDKLGDRPVHPTVNETKQHGRHSDHSEEHYPEEQHRSGSTHTTTTHNTHNSGNGIDAVNGKTVVYDRDPSSFLRHFFQCIKDKQCHIHYHHVQKTGGSYFASKLFPILDEQHRPYQSKDWCCNTPFMTQRFRNNTKHYCRRKFGVYEVKGNDFAEIIDTCSRYLGSSTTSPSSQQNEGTTTSMTTTTTTTTRKTLEKKENKALDTDQQQHPHRIVAIVSYREPIARTLSMIHHQCNKNYERKSSSEQAKCRTCSYSAHSDYWDRYVNETVATYRDMANGMTRIHGLNQHNHNRSPITLLALENDSIDSFFGAIEATFHTKLPQGRKNKQRTSVCSFGMTTEMIQALQPATRVYKNVTMGWY